MAKPIDITGERFGRLVAIKRVGVKRYPKGGVLSLWECKCDCGNTTIVPLCALRGKNRNTSSCGCLHKEIVKNIKLSHGQSHSRLNEVWKQMKKRCTNPNCKEYKYYGAKGVRVCEEWMSSFELFRDWMLSNGYNENAPRGECTIDRINPFGNYEPSNCRIIPMSDQFHNLRRNWENAHS